MNRHTSLIVIGIAGPAGSGKDSAANALIADRNTVRVALADSMKGAFDDLSGPTREFHKDLDLSGTPIRSAWQRLGTEARDRVRGASLAWIHVVAMKIAYAYREHPRTRRSFVVPDIRYPYEADTLRRIVQDLGGHYGTLALQRLGTKTPVGIAGHSSESHFAQIRAEATYRNDRSLAELRGVTISFFDAVSTGMYDRAIGLHDGEIDLPDEAA